MIIDTPHGQIKLDTGPLYFASIEALPEVGEAEQSWLENDPARITNLLLHLSKPQVFNYLPEEDQLYVRAIESSVIGKVEGMVKESEDLPAQFKADLEILVLPDLVAAYLRDAPVDRRHLPEMGKLGRITEASLPKRPFEHLRKLGRRVSTLHERAI